MTPKKISYRNTCVDDPSRPVQCIQAPCPQPQICFDEHGNQINSSRPLHNKPPSRNREAQLKMNLECAKEFGLPECLVYRSCPKEMIADEDWKDRNNKGTLGYKKYRQAKCWEMCVAMKQGNETPNFMIKQQMETMGCNKYRSGGTNEEIKKALPWIIGTAVAIILIYNFK